MTDVVLITKSEKDRTYFCHFWPIKKDLRHKLRPMAEQSYHQDTKSLADGLLTGVWASECATAGECAAKTVGLKNSERSER